MESLPRVDYAATVVVPALLGNGDRCVPFADRIVYLQVVATIPFDCCIFQVIASNALTIRPDGH